MGIYRPLHWTEARLYRQHLQRLDESSRYTRFSGTVSDAGIAVHVGAIDWRHAAVIGYFHDGVLRGAVELRYTPGFLPEAAEIGITVEPRYQGRRIGSRLVDRALLLLRNRGIAKAQITCLAGNRRIQKLALKYRASFAVSAAGDEVHITLEVPLPDPASLLAEGYCRLFGWLGGVISTGVPSTV